MEVGSYERLSRYENETRPGPLVDNWALQWMKNTEEGGKFKQCPVSAYYWQYIHEYVISL